ncbi:MAG: DUF4411 family protein [Patescibacteria group bacterium]|jgi:uncharacterized membrane-anchored protein YjiN (DUF445 family)|nr:DUF4411 family protein [Patescibacteria group bacterium]
MPKFVIDNNSLNIMLKYYYFDRNFSGIICKKILDFFIDKIRTGEIIIIDKVFAELKNWTISSKEKKYFEKGIERFRKEIITPDFLEMVDSLIEKNQVKRVVDSLSKEALDIKLQEYRDKTADFYLIAYCQKLQEMRDEVVLITEESRSLDAKPINKIPIICKKKAIRYEKLPYLMFNFYKEELKFELNN